MTDKKEISFTKAKSLLDTKLPSSISNIVFQHIIPLGKYTDKELDSLDASYLNILKKQVINKLKENDKNLTLEAKSLALNDVKFFNNRLKELGDREITRELLYYSSYNNIKKAVEYDSFNLLYYYLEKKDLNKSNIEILEHMVTEFVENAFINKSWLLLTNATNFMIKLDKITDEYNEDYKFLISNLEKLFSSKDKDFIRMMSGNILDRLHFLYLDNDDKKFYESSLDLTIKYGLVIPQTYMQKLSYREEKRFPPLYLINKAIEKGQGVNIQDKHGRTLLISIAMSDDFGDLNIEAVNLLLENDAKLNIQDEEGNTALHYFATMAGENYIELITDLIRRGADINIRNKEGKLPVDLLGEFTGITREESPELFALLTPNTE